MAKHIQLTVDNPCQESWENMSPSAKGRFCGSCQKPVLDFTNMTDAQVAAFFKRPSTGSVCGRFMQDQLNRDIALPRKRIPWIKYFFQVALPAFLVSRSAAQENNAPVKGEITVCDKKSPLLMGKINPYIQTQPATESIKGRVLDHNGSPLATAIVVIKGTNIGTTTDADGYFRFEKMSGKENIVLVASAIGYITSEIKVDPKAASTEVRMEMKEAPLMGAVIITGYIVRKKQSKPIPLIGELLPDSTAKFAKAFPNPVVAGDPLTIQCKKVAKGKYTLELLNLAGQMVQRKEVEIDNEKQNLQFNTPLVRSGAYYLKITDKKTKRSVTDKIIIQ